jgi:hypothetical protein
MSKSLFDKNGPQDRPLTPHERLAPEIAHLKKGSSVRHGPNAKNRFSPWLIVFLICALIWLYIMDPVIHGWYRGEAVRTYLYLHNYSTGPVVDQLVATGIFAPDEVHTLNNRQGAFQDYYESPQAANHQAQVIINFMKGVHLLHEGDYDQLDWIGRLRYNLFIRWSVPLPTDWTFLDPTIE